MSDGIAGGRSAPLSRKDFRSPAILLAGKMDYAMYDNFRAQLEKAPEQGLIVIELSTLGGDPEVARMMGEDMRFHAEVDTGRQFTFLGKAVIYSAGTTFMSFFPRQNRYLTRGTRLMIHERKLEEDLPLYGPISCCLDSVRAKLHEIETSIAIQNEGFANLVRDSKVSMEEVLKRAPCNWYIEAEEARELGLIRGVI